jgi:probable HAF family extracellular repeat protein
MNSTVLTRIAGTALLAVLAIPAQIIVQEEREHKREHFSQYRVKDLVTLGGTFSQAFGINNRGHVGGGASLPNGNLHAFLWTKQTGMQDLDTLGGPTGGGPG